MSRQDSGRVDLHSHVLPETDDGARSDEDALGMLAAAAADGTTVIAATPHSQQCEVEQMRASVERLNRLAAEQGIDIQVVTGGEVRFASDLAQRFRDGTLGTLNDTSYFLLEFSLRADWSPYIMRAIYELQLAGAQPILAHAERYPRVQEQPRLLVELARHGVPIQINADSLLGNAGPRARRTAETLLRSRLAHITASDAHDNDLRPPRLAEAFLHAAEVTGAEYADWMHGVAWRVLRGEPVTLPEPEVVVQRSWFGRVVSRFRSDA